MGTELWVALFWLPNPHCINESVSLSICPSLCLKYIFVHFTDVFVSVSHGHGLKAWALQTLVPLYQPMHNVCYLTPTTQQCGVRVPDDSLLPKHEEYGMVLLAFQVLFDYFKMCVTYNIGTFIYHSTYQSPLSIKKCSLHSLVHRGITHETNKLWCQCFELVWKKYVNNTIWNFFSQK